MPRFYRLTANPARRSRLRRASSPRQRVHLLATWSTYVLIVSAIAGFVLQQSGLETGALAAAMAASNASTLVFSAVFGIVVFDERLAHGGGRIGLAITGLTLAVVSVVRLGASESGATVSFDDGRATTPSAPGDS